MLANGCAAHDWRQVLTLEAQNLLTFHVIYQIKLCSMKEQSYVHLTTYAYHQDRR
jgi:hypothetical protein